MFIPQGGTKFHLAGLSAAPQSSGTCDKQQASCISPTQRTASCGRTAGIVPAHGPPMTHGPGAGTHFCTDSPAILALIELLRRRGQRPQSSHLHSSLRRSNVFLSAIHPHDRRHKMRSRFLIAAAALLPLLLVLPAAAQTAAQNTPQALKATYDQAMKAKDWPAAIAAAQQLVSTQRHSGESVAAGKRATLRGRSGRSARHL